MSTMQGPRIFFVCKADQSMEVVVGQVITARPCKLIFKCFTLFCSVAVGTAHTSYFNIIAYERRRTLHFGGKTVKMD